MAGDGSSDRNLWTAAQLARAAKISPTTIKNWSRLDPPLRSESADDGTELFRRSDLVEFCASNPRLRAGAAVLAALRALDHGAPESSSRSEVENLKAIVRDLRTAADRNMQAAVTAARQAEDVARQHREQLERLAEAHAAYDSALTSITAPGTLND